MKRLLELIYPLLAIAVVIVVWWIGALALDVEFLLPTPAQTAQQFVELLSQPLFYKSILITAMHALTAFAISLVLAFACALLASQFRVLEKIFYPFIVILRVMPTMSVIFLAIIWLSSANSPYLVVMLIVFPLLYNSIFSAIKGVDGDLLQMARVYGVKRGDIIKGLYLPSVAGAVYVQSVSTLSLSVKVAIAGEAIALSGTSLGFLLQTAKANLETGLLFAYTVAAIALGYLLELFVRLIAVLIKRLRYAKAY